MAPIVPVGVAESATDSGAPTPAPLAGPKAPPAPEVSLDDLLRLPVAVARSYSKDAEDAENLESAEPGAESDSMTDQEREAARLRIEIRRRNESAVIDPDGSLNRESTDAGVSVEVGEDTRLGGGVHVVQESDGEFRDPVPTVGVEKRF